MLAKFHSKSIHLDSPSPHVILHVHGGKIPGHLQKTSSRAEGYSYDPTWSQSASFNVLYPAILIPGTYSLSIPKPYFKNQTSTLSRTPPIIISPPYLWEEVFALPLLGQQDSPSFTFYHDDSGNGVEIRTASLNRAGPMERAYQ
ncbi:hypothetical protein AVEN_164537-1 [Araneus ventricosus]|uniref:Uncharacterized protein n=1 Tax=Araneus ventricosus TaxID=182803 RepID=A0A4Y2B4H1_ARAVE|nr:hypothetical protein AVEN_164537-1 [Araneus ventricosus]